MRFCAVHRSWTRSALWTASRRSRAKARCAICSGRIRTKRMPRCDLCRLCACVRSRLSVCGFVPRAEHSTAGQSGQRGHGAPAGHSESISARSTLTRWAHPVLRYDACHFARHCTAGMVRLQRHATVLVRVRHRGGEAVPQGQQAHVGHPRARGAGRRVSRGAVARGAWRVARGAWRVARGAARLDSTHSLHCTALVSVPTLLCSRCWTDRSGHCL